MNIFSKFINAFKCLRLNDKNVVIGQQLDHLLISSMYAEQHYAYLNSYETGLDKRILNTILEDYWGIFDKNNADEVLLDLQNKNQDKYLDIVFHAFENRAHYVTILKSNLAGEEEIFEHYLEVYRKLSNVVPMLIEQHVVQNFSALRNIRDTAWNYGRGSFLARCCYDAGYISEEELIKYLQQSHTALRNYCRTWKEYTTSYIFGRAIWGGSNNEGMIQIADDLLNSKKSLLKNKIYL